MIFSQIVTFDASNNHQFQILTYIGQVIAMKQTKEALVTLETDKIINVRVAALVVDNAVT